MLGLFFLVLADILLYACQEIPGNDTDTLGGAIDTGNQISDGDLAKIFNELSADAEGGSDRTRYGKCCIKNTHATDDYVDAKFWLANGLLDPSATGVIKFTTSHASDDDTKYIRLVCEDAAGTMGSEDVTLPAAVGSVFSTRQALISRPIRCELRLIIGDLLTTASGDITIYDANLVEIGKIPAGRKYATGEYDLAAHSTLDDSETTTNRTTAPVGAGAFSRANSEATAIDMANSGTLTAGSYQSVWLKRTLVNGDLPGEDQFRIYHKGKWSS